ncbi:IS3 family transposase [Candidatus Saccharibacteria bacterium]|nr:IS3 family transposase [Candidatus Saccharibacteria bacterium]
MGAALFRRRCIRTLSGTPRPGEEPTRSHAAKSGGRRSYLGSAAATRRGGLFKKLECLGFKKGTAGEKAQVISKLRHKHTLSVLLEISGLPRATYYYHAKQQTVPDKYLEAKTAITAICHENKGRYGYRRITGELYRRGYGLNHKTVQKLMQELGLTCRVRMKKYHSYKGEIGKIAPNLLQRNFEAEKPNQKWVTDVTEFHLFGQKLYLSPILDLCSRDIVSYSISDRPVLSMVTQMLDEAFAKIPDGTNLILHSDQGWQYQHKQYQKILKAKGIHQSMSRKGNCLDNAVIENFFGLLKSELLYLQTFESLEQFKAELIDYLDYYNNRRSKAKLKGLPPAIHRQQALWAA